MSVAILVYVSQKTEARVRAIMATWYDPASMMMACSKTHPVDGAYAVDYSADDYPRSVTAKAVLGMHELVRRFPTKKYYAVCGDDTLVNVRRLSMALERLNATEEVLIGQTDLLTKGRISRVYGGAPIVLTKASARWHNAYTRLHSGQWRRSRLPHDLWITDLFRTSGRRLVHLHGIYSQPPWFYVRDGVAHQNGTASRASAFHYVNDKQMHWLWSMWK